MRVIDLDGPDGNAFFLLGQARKWSKELGFNPCDITTEMTSGDYTHLCKTLIKDFPGKKRSRSLKKGKGSCLLLINSLIKRKMLSYLFYIMRIFHASHRL